MKLTNIKFGRDGFLLHVSSALLGLFVFYSVVFAANLLKIPFYMGYRKYIMDITVISVEADRVLWAAKWNTASTPSKAFFTFFLSRISPSTK